MVATVSRLTRGVVGRLGSDASGYWSGVIGVGGSRRGDLACGLDETTLRVSSCGGIAEK